MNKSSFEFFCPTRISFGPDCRLGLSGILSQNGWSKVGLLIDAGLAEVEPISELIQELTGSCEKVIKSFNGAYEPTYDDIDSLREQFAQQDLQAVIGIGGGSTLDLAKAMAVLVHNRKPSIAYRGFDQMTEPVLPIIALPTTAGTGSEITPNASFVDAAQKRKLGINGEAVRPCFALLDPVLTLSCPRGATVSAGVDSMVHATEAFVAQKATPLARLFAAEGFGRVFNSLPKAAADGGDLQARTEVMYGAFLAAVALMHSGTGPAAAMSYPLGVHYRVPHGIGGGVFLPAVVELNVEQGVRDYARLYDRMAGADHGLPAGQRAEQFASRLGSLLQELGVPVDLAALGVTGEAREQFVQDTLELQGALEQNPVPFGRDEIIRVLDSLSQ